MDIRILRYFLTVAREGSITSAAAVLHLTQPTLSRQLHDLEDSLGQKLFLRQSHSISLTPEGALLRKRAEEILDLVEKAEQEFRSMAEDIAGDIYIGAGESRAVGLVGAVIRQLREQYPNIHYHLYSGNAETVTQRLDQGLLDFGIIIQPADLRKYDFLPIPATDLWGVVMRKDSPLAQKTAVTKADLLGQPLICSQQAIMDSRRENEFTRWFDHDFEKLNVVATFNLLYNAAILVEQGVGYALTIDTMVNTSAESNLCFRPLSPLLRSGLDLIWKRSQVFSAAAGLFLQTVRECFASCPP